MFKLNEKITVLNGVGDKVAAPFFAKNINTLDDLINYIPISYIDYEQTSLNDNANVVLTGVITSPITTFKPRTNLLITNFTISDGIEMYKIVAFNMRHLKFAFKQSDKVTIHGKYDQHKQQISLKKIDTLKEGFDSLNIIATYSKINKTSNLKINKLINSAIDNTMIDSDFKKCLKQIHNPQSRELLIAAQTEYKEIEFTNYYKKILQMRTVSSVNEHYKLNVNMNVINDFIKGLPYRLTNAQDNAVKAGLKLLGSDSAMQSLVLGDVGSGKTIVSIIYSLVALSNDGQVAFMLPTEILAKQVYQVVCELLPNYESELLVSSTKANKKKLVKSRIRLGGIDIIIGTHTLTYDDVEFANLRLVVIDEQHRFGVHQRQRLIEKGHYVNYCYLSATPIPRTLAHTLFGVLDVISIDKKPANRKRVITDVYTKASKKQMLIKINEQLAKGNQVFIITPLAYEVEDMNIADSFTTFNTFCKYYEGKYNVGMINGQLKTEHKDQIMDMFRNKEYDILVATSVVEVGVDIPGATVIAILNAERFGLATLHQLRGRVGRNNLQSYCLLLDESNNSESKKRLMHMSEIDDGQKLATIDYQTRGMGEITGVRQSGNEDFKLFNINEDTFIASRVIEQLSTK